MNNMDEWDDLRQLFQKYLDGSATPEEQKRVESYYEIFERRANILDQFSNEDIDALERRIKSSIFEKREESEAIRQPLLRRRLIKWAAAASLIILFSSVYFFLPRNKGNVSALNGDMQLKTDLEPGADRATLVLADGRRIILDTASQGVLATQGAITINMPEQGKLEFRGRNHGNRVEYNEIITPAGGQYKLVLSDGSNVWLNAKSSIRFPTSFSIKERNVVITGEAYFEVAKSNIPFKVNVDGKQEVTVLGTHFNINSYEDESAIRTTLLEGSVKVAGSGQAAKTVVLIPGQQAALNATSNISIEKNARVEEAVAWKNGFFHYNDTDLETVLRQMARWYNVEVSYEGAIPRKRFKGKIKRDANASEVLEILGFTGLQFRIEKATDGNSTNKIIVTL